MSPTHADPLETLARLLTAEAAHVCSSIAGAAVVAVAGCVTGSDLATALRLPDVDRRERRIVLQLGQAAELGGVRLLQVLRLAGAQPVTVGMARACNEDELAATLAEGASAGLFVADPANDATGLVPLAPFVWACRRAGVPSLVLVPGGLPLAALDAGADLVVVDVARVYGGPEAGLIAGRADLVAACALQERGLGALFRPAPETVAGSLATVRRASLDLAGGLAVADHAA
jgi:L-seryl-tRNA(Ser) seleniumtransferase